MQPEDYDKLLIKNVKGSGPMIKLHTNTLWTDTALPGLIVENLTDIWLAHHITQACDITREEWSLGQRSILSW